MSNEFADSNPADNGMRRNIGPSSIGFRIAVEEPETSMQMQAEQYDYTAHMKTWGMNMDYTECVLRVTSPHFLI